MNEILEAIIKPYEKPMKQFYWKKRIGIFGIIIAVLGKKYTIEIDISSKEWS